MNVPSNFPVQPLGPTDQAKDRVTCGTCGLSWDDAIPTSYTPTPSGRCPFEYFHPSEDEECPIDDDMLERAREARPWEVKQ